SGGELKISSTTLPGRPAITGEVMQVATGDADRAPALFVRWARTGSLPDGVTLAHIDLGDVIRYSIPVTSIEHVRDGSWLHLAHDAGFQRTATEVLMTTFPGWRIDGVPTVVVE